MGIQLPKWQVGLVAISAILLVIVVNATRAQTESERYFDETGHTVRGPFLQFFDAHGGLQVLGYPITDAFFEDERLVQYFQHARMEWYPDNPEGTQVQLGLIGEELGYSQPPLAPDQIPSPGNPYCVYYAETGHSVCNAFLDYFRDNGGVDVFGYPVSEFVIEKDRIVQSFQRAKIEWHPEKPVNQKVQMANLGVVAFNRSGNPRGLLNGQPPANRPYAITRLNPRFSLKWPVTARTGDQTIYIVVFDQQNKPVSGALVSMIVHLPSGDARYNLPDATDKDGKIQFTFPFAETKSGDYVNIDVTVTLGSLATPTRISFLPWR